MVLITQMIEITLSATAQDPYKYIKLGDNEWKRSI